MREAAATARQVAKGGGGCKGLLVGLQGLLLQLRRQRWLSTLLLLLLQGETGIHHSLVARV